MIGVTSDRLDPEHVAVLVDERDCFFGRSSNSVAKTDAAAFKISFERRSSRTSPSSSRIRSTSAVVVPRRRCPSISA
jgi:hypothetical protein